MNDTEYAKALRMAKSFRFEGSPEAEKLKEKFRTHFNVNRHLYRALAFEQVWNGRNYIKFASSLLARFQNKEQIDPYVLLYKLTGSDWATTLPEEEEESTPSFILEDKVSWQTQEQYEAQNSYAASSQPPPPPAQRKGRSPSPAF